LLQLTQLGRILEVYGGAEGAEKRKNASHHTGGRYGIMSNVVHNNKSTASKPTSRRHPSVHPSIHSARTSAISDVPIPEVSWAVKHGFSGDAPELLTQLAAIPLGCTCVQVHTLALFRVRLYCCRQKSG
jgi:hypothetical protein